MDAVAWWSAGVSMTIIGAIVFGVFAVVGTMLKRRVALSHHLRAAVLALAGAVVTLTHWHAAFSGP